MVTNATSQDGFTLTYTFEVYAVGANNLTLVDHVAGLAQGAGTTTSWTPSLDLVDGPYSWRAQAFDGTLVGPWMASAHFVVAVVVPPSVPTGLKAVPGDSRVSLSWNANPEPDVVSYKVYRSTASGGPYSLVANPTAPSFLDTGLANATTYYYVVTALNAQLESAPSSEVAATPLPLVTAEIEFEPESLSSRCLSSPPPDGGDGARRQRREGDDGEGCPRWIYARIKLPEGVDPSTIDLTSVRLHGTVAPDLSYHRILGEDGDEPDRELQVRFPLEQVAPFLASGANHLPVTGHATAANFQGTGILRVAGPEVEFRPRRLGRFESRGSKLWAVVWLPEGLRAKDVNPGSLRLEGRVLAEEAVPLDDPEGRGLVVRFDRSSIALVLWKHGGGAVWLTGRAAGLRFEVHGDLAFTARSGEP